MTTGPLAGKVAIVTGAGRGIGRAIAIGYAAAGASVCCAARTPSEVESAAREISTAGGSAFAVQVDVANLQSVQAMVDATVARFGGLDILVANAGVEGDRKPVESGDAGNWRDTIATNLFGAYHCMRTAVPAIRQRGGGAIIAIGSGLGQRGGANRSDYAASKAGLSALVRALAQELLAHGINVNELVPGPVATAMTRRHQEAVREGSAPAGNEWVKPADAVVPLALFLATQPGTGPTGRSFSLVRSP